MKKILLFLIGILLFSSCTSLRNSLYLTFIDTDTGDIILQREPEVKIFLENVLPAHEYYSMKVFVRTGIYHQKKRTDLLTHSYYVLISGDGEYHTLSFYGSKMAFYSRGVWILDSDYDRNSYFSYLEGNNKWDVDELFSGWNINVQQTIRNIIDRIDAGVTYYYKAHLSNKQDADNCNTALHKTVVLERYGELN